MMANFVHQSHHPYRLPLQAEDKLEDIDVRTAWSEMERRYLIDTMPTEMHESIFDSDDDDDDDENDSLDLAGDMLMEMPSSNSSSNLMLSACLMQRQQPGPLTNKAPVVLFTSNDGSVFPPFQVMVRKTIELFEAKEEDVLIANQSNSGQRMNHQPVVLGQMGIRCHACAQLAPQNRATNATLYPPTLEQVYPAAQTLAANHIIPQCPCLSNNIRSELFQQLANTKDLFRPADAALWLQRTRDLGVYQDDSNRSNGAGGVPRFVPANGGRIVSCGGDDDPIGSMDDIFDD